MSAIQQELESTGVLPAAFLRRWSELGGPPLAEQWCFTTRFGVWFGVRVRGRRPHVFLAREDAAACADELFALTQSR